MVIGSVDDGKLPPNETVQTAAPVLNGRSLPHPGTAGFGRQRPKAPIRPRTTIPPHAKYRGSAPLQLADGELQVLKREYRLRDVSFVRRNQTNEMIRKLNAPKEEAEVLSVLFRQDTISAR
jgi:hypothetical protein